MVGKWIENRSLDLGLKLEDLSESSGFEVKILQDWMDDRGKPPSTEDLQILSRTIADPNHPIGASFYPIYDQNLAIGNFVFNQANHHGVGKITEIADQLAKVEYFSSVSERLEYEIPINSLVKTQASYQTRCYFQDNLGSWSIGRIENGNESDGYLINLPDEKFTILPEKDIYIRCDDPIKDPTDILKLRAHETAFFHTRRRPFVNALFSQTTACRGLTGLISSNINLYQHQVNIASRVLQDPVQRYLLADEVGLGKTIEAGIIIRQYLLDDTSRNVIILVPSNLQTQWKDELNEKFNALDNFGRVTISTPDNLKFLKDPEEFGLCVIDESHHIASLGTSINPDDKLLYQQIEAFTSTVPRLLLLSATPILNNERNFLAMLHLLDPDIYSLEQIDDFKDKISYRSQVGEILMLLQEDASEYVLEHCINQLRNLMDGKLVPPNLLQELEQDLKLPSGNRERHINQITSYVSETLRIHRRLLRTRRKDLPDDFLTARQKDSTFVSPEMDEDSRMLEALSLIESWRQEALSHLSITTPIDRQDWLLYRSIFQILVEGSGTWNGLLSSVVTTRLSQNSNESLDKDLGATRTKILVETPYFPNEKSILEAIVNCLNKSKDPQEVDRLELLISIIRDNIQRQDSADSTSKFVIFTSFPSVRRKIHTTLQQVFGSATVAVHGIELSSINNEKEMRRFRNFNETYIMVCDHSAEEGRNLQFSDNLVHFDLPLSPNRIEQRIGRLDRIGQTKDLHSYVLIGPVSDMEYEHFEEAWYTLMSEGFNVFEKSIASLQFFVDGKLPTLIDKLFEYGTSSNFGLLSEIEQLKQDIDIEHAKNDEQRVLDEVETSSEGFDTYYQALIDSDSKDEVFHRQLHPWLSEGLIFDTIKLTRGPSSYRYNHGQNTLIPTDLQVNRIMPHSGHPSTYGRTTSLQFADSRILRVGNNFLDAILNYVQWDDRGKVFAFWRQCDNIEIHEPLLNIWFTYHIRIDSDHFLKIPDIYPNTPEFKALTRKGHWYFPPMAIDWIVDSSGNQVQDRDIRDLVLRPFRTTGQEHLDTNLTKENLYLLDTVISPDRWATLLDTCRQQSELAIKSHEQLKTLCLNKANEAKRTITNEINQLKARQSYESNHRYQLSVNNADLTRMAMLQDAYVSGISNPELTVDSIGLILLSNLPPK